MAFLVVYGAIRTISYPHGTNLLPSASGVFLWPEVSDSITITDPFVTYSKAPPPKSPHPPLPTFSTYLSLYYFCFLKIIPIKRKTVKISNFIKLSVSLGYSFAARIPAKNAIIKKPSNPSKTTNTNLRNWINIVPPLLKFIPCISSSRCLAQNDCKLQHQPNIEGGSDLPSTQTLDLVAVTR